MVGYGATPFRSLHFAGISFLSARAELLAATPWKPCGAA
jgi:hypothetical protein